MRILICGLGSIGRRHLRNLVSLGQADIVLYRSGKSTLPDDELGDWPTTNSLEEALENWSPDAAVVSNPTALHLETAHSAVKAGCHLFLEKPISDRMEGVRDLSLLLDQNRRRALVGFQFRFHPGLIAAREVIQRGLIGYPISARSQWGEYLPDWHPWEDYRQGYSARADLGGGVLLTLCHPFDYLRWLLGEPHWVSAAARRAGGLEVDVEDTAEVLIGFKQGPLASVHLDYYQRPAQHCLEVIGSQGGLQWKDSTGEMVWWSEGEPTWHDVPAPEGFERNAMFMDEMRHFLEVVEGRADPICTLEDGAQALRLALAARQSTKSGRRVEIDAQ